MQGRADHRPAGAPGRAPPARAAPGTPPAPPSAKVTSAAPTFTDWPGPDVDALDAARERRGDLDARLVGLDFQQRRVLGDVLPLRDEDLDDLGLGQALAEVGQGEGARPWRLRQKASVSRAAATMRATSGTFAFSRAKPTKGTS